MSVKWAEAAIKAHRKAGRIVGDEATQVWHLLLSTMELCKQTNIDFDELIKSCREYQAEFDK